jgi:hypothetical protein
MVWRDPQFDPNTPRVYDLRVLEIPTLRWVDIALVDAGTPVIKGIPAVHSSGDRVGVRGI